MSKNAEYQAKREAQGMLQAKINKMKSELSRASIIDPEKLPKGEVVFGCTVVVKDLDYDDEEETGEVSHFQALSTALSATVGTGNIAGVATAISLGGPGALFWMWVTAFFGMATKFTECTLALKFRQIDEHGEISGGPMYTLLNGLQMKRMAVLFASFALIASFGIGNMAQSNSVADPISRYLGLAAGLDHRHHVGLGHAEHLGHLGHLGWESPQRRIRRRSPRRRSPARRPAPASGDRRLRRQRHHDRSSG